MTENEMFTREGAREAAAVLGRENRGFLMTEGHVDHGMHAVVVVATTMGVRRGMFTGRRIFTFVADFEAFRAEVGAVERMAA